MKQSSLPDAIILPSTAQNQVAPAGPLAVYVVRRVFGTLCWVLGGTLLAWLAVWLKYRVEDPEKLAFHTWVIRDIFGTWWIDHEEIRLAFSALGHTLFLVIAAVVISGAISVLLGWKTSRAPHGRSWDMIDSVFSAFGGLPLFFLCFLAMSSQWEVFRAARRDAASPGWVIMAAAIAVLAWGEGNTSLWIRTFRRQFGRLRRAPHIIAAQARGLPLTRRLARDTAGLLIESIGSRMVLLLSGAAIVEYILNLQDGIGYAIIRQLAIQGTSYSALAAYSLALVIAAAVLRGVDVVARDWTRRAGAVQS